MSDKLKNLAAVNILVLILGIPTIWLIGLVWREPFIWAETFGTLINSLILVNIPSIFKHFRTKKN